MNKLISSTFLIVALFFYTEFAQAQTVVLEVDREEEKEDEKTERGPGRKNHNHLFFGLDFITGPMEEGGEIKQPGSMSYYNGLRMLFNYSGSLGFGIELSYHSHNYKLRQKEGKLVPDTIINYKEKLRTDAIRLGIFKRFVFSDKESLIGNFIDLGGAAEYNIINYHIIKNKADAVHDYRGTKLRYSGIGYNNVYNVHAFFRLGFNRIVFNASYRLTDMFDTSYDYPELPRINVGIQLGLH